MWCCYHSHIGSCMLTPGYRIGTKPSCCTTRAIISWDESKHDIWFTFWLILWGMGMRMWIPNYSVCYVPQRKTPYPRVYRVSWLWYFVTLNLIYWNISSPVLHRVLCSDKESLFWWFYQLWLKEIEKSVRDSYSCTGIYFIYNFIVSPRPLSTWLFYHLLVNSNFCLY